MEEKNNGKTLEIKSCGRNNWIGIAGTVGAPILEMESSRKILGAEIGAIFAVKLRVKRESGMIDEINIIIPKKSESETGSKRIKEASTGEQMMVIGSVQQVRDKETGKTMLFVYASFAAMGEHVLIQNDVILTGKLANTAYARRTPKGRKITDAYLEMDSVLKEEKIYIPCIFWGNDAEVIAHCRKGAEIGITGRMQSRDYIKRCRTQEGAMEDRKLTTHEVSVQKFTIMEGEVRGEYGYAKRTDHDRKGNMPEL